MPDRAVLASAGDGHSVSDGRFVCQAVLSLWAYSVVCGAIAIGLGEITAVLAGAVLPASWVRLGTIGATVLAAGLNSERVLRHVEIRLGVPPAGGSDTHE